jgi:hypothetical protein
VNLPSFLEKCLCSHDEALRAIVRSGATIASGFATSEPHNFYARLWSFIQQNDIRDLRIKQALFMAPHPLCVGDALSARDRLAGAARRLRAVPLLGTAAARLGQASRKLDGLSRLIAHYRELQARRITFSSPFLGPANNIIVPDLPLLRLLYPDFAGRNTSRMGIMDMQSIHFPDAVESMGIDAEGKPLVDAFVFSLTPPDPNGELSHGIANGANGEILERIIRQPVIDTLIYLNPGLPFTRGYGDAQNTVAVERLRPLAEAHRLRVVLDDGPLPCVPAGTFTSPSETEQRIAEHIVNHIEQNLELTRGRAIQVGIGGTGVQAIRGLRQSSWSGRQYSEMLDPFTLELFEAGKIAGSHFVEPDGRRTPLDGKMVCTFTMAEAGSDFYRKLDRNPAIIVAPASRVVISEAFFGGMGINNVLGVDFHGHVNSGGRDRNHFSGVGGGAMIFRGLANGGVGYLCLKSTHRTPEGKLRSSIFPYLPRGTPISHVGPDLMGGRNGARLFVATEHGIFRVSGRSQAEFIRGLISIAHPRFRKWLARQAWREFRVVV